MPESLLHERVDGEWSFVETQRHLLFASDAWLGNAVLEEESPVPRVGATVGRDARGGGGGTGLTLDVTPTLDEVLEPRLLRMACVRRVMADLTEAESSSRVRGRRSQRDPTPISSTPRAVPRWSCEKRDGCLLTTRCVDLAGLEGAPPPTWAETRLMLAWDEPNQKIVHARSPSKWSRPQLRITSSALSHPPRTLKSGGRGVTMGHLRIRETEAREPVGRQRRRHGPRHHRRPSGEVLE